MAVETFTDQNRSDSGFKKRVIGGTYIQNADRKCHPDCRGPHEKQAGFSTLTDDGDDGHSGSAFEEGSADFLGGAFQVFSTLS